MPRRALTVILRVRGSRCHATAQAPSPMHVRSQTRWRSSGMGSTVPGMTEIGTDWRVVDGVATAWFDAPSLVEGAAGRAHRRAVGRDGGRPARDRHAGAPRLPRARRGGVGGRAGSRAGREPCRAPALERRVRIREPVCGEAVLAARARLHAWGGRRSGGSVAARPRATDPAVDRATAVAKPHPPRRGAAGRGGRAGESW